MKPSTAFFFLLLMISGLSWIAPDVHVPASRPYRYGIWQPSAIFGHPEILEVGTWNGSILDRWSVNCYLGGGPFIVDKGLEFCSHNAAIWVGPEISSITVSNNSFTFLEDGVKK